MATIMFSRSEWYLPGQVDPSIDLAREAFQEAKTVLLAELCKGNQNRALVLQATRNEDIEALISSTKAKYDASHKNGKASKWLSKLSQRVRYYGSILDVMSQHHPEYVSLAWGAMKLVFVLIENHDKLVTTLSKALSNIADSLARVNLAIMLYPTPRMKHAVAQMYTSLMRFWIRACDWYNASKIQHAWDSFARPVELRYADLIENIESCARDVENLATVAARVEQRDVHLEILKISQRMENSEQKLSEVRQLIVSHQAIKCSGQLNTNTKLTDAQCSEAIRAVVPASMSDSRSNLRYAKLTIRRHGSTLFSPFLQFWLHPKFEKWNTRSLSAVLAIKGDYYQRFDLRHICVDVIEELNKNRVPVIWALRPAIVLSDHSVTVSEMIKDLICQSLRLCKSSHTEKSIGELCARFHTAKSEEEWLDLLVSILVEIEGIYLVIDVATAGVQVPLIDEGFSWIGGFQMMFSKIRERNARTTVKVLLVGYGAAALRLGNAPGFVDSTINMKQMLQTQLSSQRQLPRYGSKPRWKNTIGMERRIL